MNITYYIILRFKKLKLQFKLRSEKNSISNRSYILQDRDVVYDAHINRIKYLEEQLEQINRQLY